MKITSASGIQPIDAGYGLIHADTIIATTCDELQPGEEGLPFSLSVGERTTSGPVSELGLGTGTYAASLKMGSDAVDVTLILGEPDCVRRNFGARETGLAYGHPVVIGPGLEEAADRYVDWDSLWKDGPHTDVVVDFDAGYKLMFWRGTGYVPAWAADNILTTNFFAETVVPGVYRDCCEPMSDRECRYSKVRILHSSPARCVVHWRYALCDADYRIYEDTWVDEWITVYPDGVAVRNCTIHLDASDPINWQECPRTGEKIPIAMIGGMQGKRSFSNTEFITVNPPGLCSDDVMPPGALSLLDLKDFHETYTWPDVPDFAAEPAPQLDRTVFRMNYRDRQNLFLTTGPEALEVRLQARLGMRYMAYPDVSQDWWDRGCELPGRFADFIHWPVTRGHWTRSIEDSAMYADRPTHTFLGYATNRAVRVAEDGAASWAWFCGMAPDDDDRLREVARSWHLPAGISGARYERLEGAYHVESQDGLELSDEPAHRATFVLPGVLDEGIALLVNGREFAAAVGVEEDDSGIRTIVTAVDTIPAESTVAFGH